MNNLIKCVALSFSCFVIHLANVKADVEGCNYVTDYQVQINKDAIRFSHKTKQAVTFSGNQLSIGGKSIDLSSKQQAQSLQLQQETRLFVPQVAGIATDAAEIGVTAATIVMDALLGGDPATREELVKPIEAIASKVKMYVNEQNFDGEALEKAFNEDFEKEIEALTEKAVSRYSGKAISGLMNAIFSGDEKELNDFEFRMENLESEIEQKVEKQARSLEEKAEKLCQRMEAIYQLDQSLTAVDGYPEKGLFHRDSEKGFQINRFSWNH